MGIVGNIVAFCCLWWLVFFMILSRDFEVDHSPTKGCVKSAPKFFSFKDKFKRVSKITLIVCLVLNILAFMGLFEWIIP